MGLSKEKKQDLIKKFKTHDIVKVRFYDKESGRTIDLDMSQFDMNELRKNYIFLETMKWETLEFKCKGKDKGMEGF